MHHMSCSGTLCRHLVGRQLPLLSNGAIYLLFCEYPPPVIGSDAALWRVNTTFLSQRPAAFDISTILNDLQAEICHFTLHL